MRPISYATRSNPHHPTELELFSFPTKRRVRWNPTGLSLLRLCTRERPIPDAKRGTGLREPVQPNDPNDQDGIRLLLFFPHRSSSLPSLIRGIIVDYFESVMIIRLRIIIRDS